MPCVTPTCMDTASFLAFELTLMWSPTFHSTSTRPLRPHVATSPLTCAIAVAHPCAQSKVNNYSLNTHRDHTTLCTAPTVAHMAVSFPCARTAHTLHTRRRCV